MNIHLRGVKSLNQPQSLAGDSLHAPASLTGSPFIQLALTEADLCITRCLCVVRVACRLFLATVSGEWVQPRHQRDVC